MNAMILQMGTFKALEGHIVCIEYITVKCDQDLCEGVTCNVVVSQGMCNTCTDFDPN
jgi:hypothetical protein